MTRFRAIVLIASCFLSTLIPTVGRAAWQQDGNPVVVTSAYKVQYSPKAVSDGAGGAIIVWQDNRTSFCDFCGPNSIYVQRIDAYGIPQWTTNGIAISTSGNDADPRIISDGAGGAIITWERNPSVVTQRVNANGVPQWSAGGVMLSTTATNIGIDMCSDNAGGAIVAWSDARVADPDIYARRINSAGVAQWTANGVAVHGVLAGGQLLPRVAADGSGGIVVVWQDSRSGNNDVYCAHLNSAGSLLTPANGAPVCTAANSQTDAVICADGTGGAIIAWGDSRTGASDIYAQYVFSNGNVQWALNGIAIAVQPGLQSKPAILGDGSGNAIIAWEDSRSGSAIYAQRVTQLGTVSWTTDGVALDAGGVQGNAAIVTDGLGGAIVSWEHTFPFSLPDIYARRISSAGVPQWTADGVALCTAPNTQRAISLLSDGVGGAIAVFSDGRATEGAGNVYAQRVERNGYWGYPSPNIAKVRDVAGDQGGQVNVSWDASRLDPWPNQLIDHYTVWRSLSPAAAAAAIAAGAGVVRDDGLPMLIGKHQAIRAQEFNQATYYWQLIHTVSAYGLNGYSDIVPTPFDSTATSNGAIAFQVIAHAATGYWISLPATGRSLDNLAPSAPLQLSAQRVGSDVHLIWRKNHEVDFENYKVYRQTSSGVTAIPGNFLSDATDTVLVDASAPASSLYYIVTALDMHDNQGPKSNEAGVSAVTGVGDTPRSFALSLSNYPNPFNPRTTVNYTVPSRGTVSIRVYDAAGALVATLLDRQQRSAGAFSVDWDGHDLRGAAVGSGMYFARIEHNGETRTQKMVLLK